MKPVAQVAGSRRRALKAGAGLLAALCGGCVAATPRRSHGLLEPVFSIPGGRLITRMDAAGGARPDALGAYVPLIFPVAVAAAFGDIYIADAGASRLYRYDRSLDAMAVMPNVVVGAATRLQTGPDGSIYVLDPFTSDIRRYSRGGQPLPSLRGRQVTSRYSDFAVDPLSGRVYAVDSAHLCIDEIHPVGLVAIEMQRIEEAGPIATDGRGIFLGGTRCACVAEWIRGRQGRRFSAGSLRQPKAIALEGNQIFAIDAFDRSIARLHEEAIEQATPASLGLVAPESLTIAGGIVHVADGAGHRVSLFRPGRSA